VNRVQVQAACGGHKNEGVCGPGVHENADGVVIEPDLELHGFSGREPCDGMRETQGSSSVSAS
jgi:hypothetical protein